jgi:hypothetical protein
VTVRFFWKMPALCRSRSVARKVLAKPVLTFFGWAGTALMAVTVVALSGPRSAEPVRVVCHEYRSSTTVRNCTRDEGRSFEFGNQVLTSSYRKAAATIICMEKPCGTYAARPSRLGAGL